MSRLGSLKYDFIIYTSLFIAFVCAIASCISPSSAVSEAPVVEAEEQEIIKIQEPEELQRTILSYISGVEEFKLLWHSYTAEEYRL